MSGGSMDYLCFHVTDAAESLSKPIQSELRRQFAEHLKLVAEALHDIEWVDSGDKSPGDENEAIRHVLAT